MGTKIDTINFLKKIKKNTSNAFKRKIPVSIPVYKGDLLKNRTALITGGSSGIGYAIGKAFLDNGATIIITGRNKEKLDKSLKKLKEEYKNVYSIDLDISDIDSMDDKIKEIDKMLNGKKIDILVNNAGVFSSSSFGNIKEEEFDKVIDANLKGTCFLSQKVSNYMKKNKIKGNILNIASSSSLRPATTPYSVSKWGIRGLTIGMAKKLIDDGIVVNGIAPGPTATEMLKGDSNNITKSQYPLDRYIMPEEIANLAVFLTSDMGRMIVGDIIYMTGGLGTITVDDLSY